MNSIGLAVAWLFGSAIGLALISRYPSGLDGTYGWTLMLAGVLMLAPMKLAWGNRLVVWCCLLSAMALAGCGRAMLVHPTLTRNDLGYYNGPADSPKVLVTGTISEEPALEDRWQRIRVRVEQVRLPGETQARPVRGEMLAILARYPAHDIGERLTLLGALTPPPEIAGFDYAAYLSRQGVYSYMSYPKVSSLGPAGQEVWSPKAWLVGPRRVVRTVLQKSVAEPEAALAVGVVIGDRSSLPKDLQDAFQLSGTTHVLAISGENIALLVGFIWLIYVASRGIKRMPAWLVIVVLVLLVFYTAFTGATASVVRAAVMAGVLLLGPVLGRRYDPVAALAVSALVMTAVNPYTLADAGFQLSFGAMLGIALLSPYMYRAMRRVRVPALLALAFSTSLGAQAATLPLTALLIGRVSTVSLLATLCIDVALLPLMIMGIVTGIVGALVPPVGVVCGFAVWLFGAWMVCTIGYCHRLRLLTFALHQVKRKWANDAFKVDFACMPIH